MNVAHRHEFKPPCAQPDSLTLDTLHLFNSSHPLAAGFIFYITTLTQLNYTLAYRTSAACASAWFADVVEVHTFRHGCDACDHAHAAQGGPEMQSRGELALGVMCIIVLNMTYAEACHLGEHMRLNMGIERLRLITQHMRRVLEERKQTKNTFSY
jgi:hypothetical protein